MRACICVLHQLSKARHDGRNKDGDNRHLKQVQVHVTDDTPGKRDVFFIKAEQDSEDYGNKYCYRIFEYLGNHTVRSY